MGIKQTCKQSEIMAFLHNVFASIAVAYVQGFPGLLSEGILKASCVATPSKLGLWEVGIITESRLLGISKRSCRATPEKDPGATGTQVGLCSAKRKAKARQS